MPKIFYMEDLAKESGLSVRAIRAYRKEGLIRPVASGASDYQIFDEVALERLKEIKNFRKGGVTLEQLRQMMTI